MSQSFRWSPALLAGLLLVQTGCISQSLLTDSNASANLPPNQSADLCLSLAAKEEQNGLLAEAAGHYEQARHYNPSLPDVGHRLGILYTLMGDHRRAMAEYEKELAAHPNDAELLNDAGYCHYDNGNWTEAEKYFRRALAINPQYKMAWTNLGLTLGQQQRYQEGMDAFVKAGSQADAECNMAFVYTTQGKRAEAKEAYRRALAQDPQSKLALGALQALDKTDDDSQRTSAKPIGLNGVGS